MRKNLKLMSDAEVLLIANVPFGKANIENLRGLEQFNGEIYIHRNCFDNDFTPDKEAVYLLKQLCERKNAVIISDNDEFVNRM